MVGLHLAARSLSNLARFFLRSQHVRHIRPKIWHAYVYNSMVSYFPDQNKTLQAKTADGHQSTLLYKK